MAFPDTGNPGKEASLIDEINRLRLILREQCRANNTYDAIRSEAFSLASLPFKPPKWTTKKTTDKNIKYYNSLIVIDNDINVVGEYNKQKLVPFGEFLPFEKVLRKIGFKKGYKKAMITLNTHNT